MRKGIQSDRVFPRKRAPCSRHAVCQRMNFSKICNYNYNFNSWLKLLVWREHFLFILQTHTYEYAMFDLGHVETDVIWHALKIELIKWILRNNGWWTIARSRQSVNHDPDRALLDKNAMSCLLLLNRLWNIDKNKLVWLVKRRKFRKMK